MNTTQILYEVRQPESMINLVEGMPVQEGQKLLEIPVQQQPWQEILGLSWIMLEDY